MSTTGRLRRSRALLAVLVVATIITGAVALPHISVSGVTDVIGQLELGSENPAEGARASAAVSENESGYVIEGRSSGTISVPVPGGPPPEGRRVVALVTASAPPGVETRVQVASAGRRRVIGDVDSWVDEPLDVTEEARAGARLRFRVTNERPEPVLVLDRVLVTSSTPDAETSASGWVVGVLAALLLAVVLQARGRLTRHWPLPLLGGVGTLLLWNGVRAEGLTPVSPSAESLWQAVTSAPIIDLHSGILSGASDTQSSLALQLFQLLEPIVGSGDAAVRGASALAGAIALALIYAAGARVAGRAGAITATIVAIVTDAFRTSAVSGEATTALICAATVFVFAIHICLPRTGRVEANLLGGAGALVFLADPTWVIGVLAALLALPLLKGPSPEEDVPKSPETRAWAVLAPRLRIAGAALLVLVVLLIPNRVSLADQSNGDALADLRQRATFARNVEFVGRVDDRGAPSEEEFAENPYGGSPSGLLEYLFWDHAASVVVGGTLTGANDFLETVAERPESKVAGLAGFMVVALGGLYLLILPRLRLLLILPFLAAAPALFFESRGAVSAFAAGSAAWPGLLMGAGVLAYAAVKLGGRRGGDHLKRFRRLGSRFRRGSRRDEDTVASDGAVAARREDPAELQLRR